MDINSSKITGEWLAADPSTHAIALAATDQPGVIALADSTQQQRPLFVTRQQLSNFIGSASQGGFGTLLAE